MYIPAWAILLAVGFAAYRFFSARKTPEANGIADNSIKMLGEIILIEFFSRNPEASPEDWLQYFGSVNIGRELLDRGFVSYFSTPQKINARIRKALIKIMIEREQSGAPKGANFDSRLKELLVIDSQSSKS